MQTYIHTCRDTHIHTLTSEEHTAFIFKILLQSRLLTRFTWKLNWAYCVVLWAAAPCFLLFFVSSNIWSQHWKWGQRFPPKCCLSLYKRRKLLQNNPEHRVQTHISWKPEALYGLNEFSHKALSHTSAYLKSNTSIKIKLPFHQVV